jgi:tRNA pseudouridine55 synthase
VTAGFLIVDKPAGITSHDVVDRVRRATGVRKVGHAGTLDPMATGLVIVAVGSVTRLIRFFQDLEKEYVATAVFGVATDTLDADGEVVDTLSMAVSPEDLERVKSRFLGEIQQVPPMVSALKLDGQRLYELARQGVEVKREARRVMIHDLEFLSVEPGEHPRVSFRVVCGKGTYVRSLADDIARALGGFAHLSALRRTRTGPLTVDGAITVERLADWSEHLVEPADALAFMPRLEVGPADAKRVGDGRTLDLVDHPPGIARVVDDSGRLLAVYSIEDGVARPAVVLG